MEKVGEWLQREVPVDPSEEDIRQSEDLKGNTTAQADIETARTIRQTFLLDIRCATI